MHIVKQDRHTGNKVLMGVEAIDDIVRFNGSSLKQIREWLLNGEKVYTNFNVYYLTFF